VGVAVLDTKDLHTSTRKEKLISTRSFCVGERLFWRDVTNKYKFGNSELIRPDELEPPLKSIISNQKFALIFHDRHHDIKFLEHLQINLRPNYLFDTSYSTEEMMGSSQSLRLGDLAKHFRCLDIPQPTKFCKPQTINLNLDSSHFLVHNAGNDANTTLRVFLMLVVLEFLNSTTAASNEPMLKALQRIAQ
jgi:hypothetical protein